MSPDRPLRIAICCHSVNPRGGVAHGLEVAEALARLGHEAVVHAPDPDGRGFFRQTACETVAIPARRIEAGDTAAMVEARVGDYLAHFDARTVRCFDVFHAQDGISGNALANLKQAGGIRRFARTVHHIDAFSNPCVAALQRRAIVAADAHFVVSRLWRDHLAVHENIPAALVGNGVDMRRFNADPDGRETGLRARLALGGAPVVLAVGGVETRKNTIGLLGAFTQVRRVLPGAQLLIVGGATLLDHTAYKASFDKALAASGLPDEAVVLAGPLSDADMPALYRVADVLAFPSLKEGFGLAALEAMACATPVVVSSIAPFTEYLGPQDAAWCDPASDGSIANALMAALAWPLHERLSRRGPQVAARFDWESAARAHLPVYRGLAEPIYA